MTSGTPRFPTDQRHPGPQLNDGTPQAFDHITIRNTLQQLLIRQQQPIPYKSNQRIFFQSEKTSSNPVISDIEDHPMEPGILHPVDILHTWHIILHVWRIILYIWHIILHVWQIVCKISLVPRMFTYIIIYYTLVAIDLR